MSIPVRCDCCGSIYSAGAKKKVGSKCLLCDSGSLEAYEIKDRPSAGEALTYAYSDEIRSGMRKHQCIKELEAEVLRLRGLLHQAGHSLQNNWAIDWTPILEIMREVDLVKEDA